MKVRPKQSGFSLQSLLSIPFPCTCFCAAVQNKLLLDGHPKKANTQ